MAPFSIPTPSIIPLRLPIFGGPKRIDSNTKIQLSCDTYLDYEIFFTLDGTKPQPYAGIVQGSKLIKYSSPFCLTPGKNTIKAIAINANVHTMHSSVVTKCYEVLKVESVNDNKQSAKVKQTKNSKLKKKCESVENKKKSNGMMNIQDEKSYDVEIHRFNTESMKDDEDILDCFDEAFIGGSEFDTENSDLEDTIEDGSSFPVNNDVSDNNNNDVLGESDDIKLCDVAFEQSKGDSLSETIEELHIPEENVGEPNIASANDTVESGDTQFCCLKCDLTLQQCILCNRMNGVSSKFCIGCGKQLSRICTSCSEYNPSIATFCQYCGNKLNSTSIKLDPIPKVDHSSMAKPESKNAASQMLPVMIDKNTQTVVDKSPVKKSPDLKRIPRHSPGRGYWHQQLDYICNHLKSHGYNNVEFRKEISDPILCNFKSAHITRDEDSVRVTVVFSPLKDKKDPSASKETKSKGNVKEDA